MLFWIAGRSAVIRLQRSFAHRAVRTVRVAQYTDCSRADDAQSRRENIINAVLQPKHTRFLLGYREDLRSWFSMATGNHFRRCGNQPPELRCFDSPS